MSRLVKTSIKIIISIAALYFVFRQIEFQTVFNEIKNSKLLFIFLALFAFIISKWIAAFRLNYFFRTIDIKLSELINIRLYLVGMYYNLFLPGGIGGDGYKIFLLNKKTEIKTKKIFWVVLVDRLNGIFALFVLAVLLSYLIPLIIDFNYKPIIWIIIPIAFFSFYLFLRKVSSYLIKVIPKTIIQSFFVQGFQLLSAYLILKSFGNLENETSYLFIFLISSIVAMFPVSIGGMGLRELTFLYGARILSLNEEVSISISLIFYLITACVSLFGIYYSIYPKKLGIDDCMEQE